MSTHRLRPSAPRPGLRSKRATLVSLALLTLALGACAGLMPGHSSRTPLPPTGEAGPDSVVARIDGQEITLAQVDEALRQELWEHRFGPDGGKTQALYDARSEILSRLIRDRLVADEAAKQDVSAEAWLDDAVRKLDPASVEKVKAFYDENRSRLPDSATFEELAPRIATYLKNEARDQVAARLAQGREVDVLLTPPRVSVAPDGPALGPESAPVTLVEFSDFQCPYCRRAAPMLDQLHERFPDQLRLVYRHLPLAIHEHARDAARASICADAQGRFWDYHDLLFEKAPALGTDDLHHYAEQLELDTDAFDACLADEATDAKVNTDLEAARVAGARGTPAFFLNGIPISGARPLEEFVDLVERELAHVAEHGADGAGESAEPAAPAPAPAEP